MSDSESLDLELVLTQVLGRSGSRIDIYYDPIWENYSFDLWDNIDFLRHSADEYGSVEDAKAAAALWFKRRLEDLTFQTAEAIAALG